MNIFELLIILFIGLLLVILYVATIPEDYYGCFMDTLHEHGFSKNGGCKGSLNITKRKVKMKDRTLKSNLYHSLGQEVQQIGRAHV